MSLKILKQQLKDVAIEEAPKEKVSRKERKRKALPEVKFTKSKKVMKKNMKPKGQEESIEDNISRIKEEVMYAREREEANKEWNMKLIDAVSNVDGTDIMNRYLYKKGLVSSEKVKTKRKTKADSYRMRTKAKKNAEPASFKWV